MNILEKLKNNLEVSKDEIINEIEKLYSAISIDHVAFRVSNIRKTVQHYADHLPIEILFESETRACILYNGQNICFTLGNKHPNHISFKVNSIDDMPAFAKKSQIKKHSDGVKYIYLNDFDGNAIEWVCFD